MIYTGNYDNCNGSQVISISSDKGLSIGYRGNSFSKLASKLSFWKTWHDNIGVLSEKENNDFYIEHYYQEVLLNLNADEIHNSLEKNSIMLWKAYFILS